jgi:hypothetical protein
MNITKIVLPLLLTFVIQQAQLASGIPPENHKSEIALAPQSLLAKIAMIPSKVASGTLTFTSVGAVLGSTVGCVILARQWGRLSQINMMDKRISRALGVGSALMTLYALRKSFKNYKEDGDVYLMSIGLFAGFSYGLLVPFRIPTTMLITGTLTRPASQPLPPGQTPIDHPA